MECGWLLTACDVATIDSILAGDEAAGPRMMAAFEAMRRMLTTEYMEATTEYSAATIHLKMLWVVLRQGAFERAVQTGAPCGPPEIQLYRSIATTQGFDEDMGGMLLRIQMTVGGAPIIAWWGRLQDSEPQTTPMWPREPVIEHPLSAPDVPAQLASMGGQPSDSRGGVVGAAQSPAPVRAPIQQAESSGQSVVHESTLRVRTGGIPGSRETRTRDPGAAGRKEGAVGAQRGGSAGPTVAGGAAIGRPLMQPAVPRRRAHGAAQAAAAVVPPEPPLGPSRQDAGCATPMEVDTPDGGEAAAGPSAVQPGTLSPACLLPPGSDVRRQPLVQALERAQTRPLVRLAAEPSHDDPTGVRLRGQVFGPDDIEGCSGSSFIKGVGVQLGKFEDATVSITVSVLHFRDFWVAEWFSSTSVQYGVVKAAVLAGGGVIAVPSDHLKGLASRDPSSDAEARAMLQHLIAWLKKAKALAARCILIPVPTGKHWGLAVVYSPGAAPMTLTALCPWCYPHHPQRNGGLIHHMPIRRTLAVRKEPYNELV